MLGRDKAALNGGAPVDYAYGAAFPLVEFTTIPPPVMFSVAFAPTVNAPGVAPRSKISMMIMRPPQHGQGRERGVWLPS